MQPCQCQPCLEKISSHRDTSSYFYNQFIEMLKDGRVQHVGTNAQGQPVYKDMR